MLGLTPDTWGALGTAAGGAGTIAAVIYGRMAASDKRAHDLEMEAVKTTHKNATDNLEKEQARVRTSLEQAWTKIDDLRDNAVRKTELKEFRAETKQDMKDLGDRLERAIKDAIGGIKREGGGN